MDAVLCGSLLLRLQLRVDAEALACASEGDRRALEKKGGSLLPLGVRLALGLAAQDPNVWML